MHGAGTAPTATGVPVRNPDGTGRTHHRLHAIDGTTELACGTYGRWLVPVPAADVADGDRCRRCWPEMGREG
jgi:hypothetical protein